MRLFKTMFAVVAVVMAFSANASAGENMHQVTIEDVMKFRIINNFELLPDQEVLLRIQDRGSDCSFARDLFKLDSRGDLKQLTFKGKFKGDFAVSPDGLNVVWAGELDGRSGLALLPLTGGESRLLVELPVMPNSLRWSGNRIYFSAAVFPECGLDFSCTVKKLADRRKDTSAMVYDDLYVRPWNNWADGTRNNLFVYDMMTGSIDAVASGDFDIPTIPWGGVDDYAISPDGKSVCYTAKKVDKKYLSTNDDLFEVTNGKEKKITVNPASDRVPRYSPDGRFIAFLSQDVPGYESDRIRLKVYNRKSGEIVSLTESLDDWVMEFVWEKDSKSLVATVAREGRRVLYRVSLDKREGCTPIFDRNMYRHLTMAADGRTLYYTLDSITTPPELYSMDVQTGASRKLTSLNDEALSHLLMPEIEEIRWDGAEVKDGTRQRVHGFLARPVDSNGKAIKKKVPLVVMVHGGPQGAWENSMHPRWTPLGLTGNGYAVAMPNPTGSFGYGQDFVVKVSDDWGGRAYEDIMAMVDYLDKDAAIDGTRVAAMGGSYGGYMANWMQAKAGKRFKTLISHAGPADLDIMYGTTDELWFPEYEMRGTPWEYPDEVKKWSPLSYVIDFKTPMLIIHGANDFRVPLEQALAMFTALKRRDIEARLVVFPDEDHFVNTPKNRRFWYRTVNEWLDKYLKK